MKYSITILVLAVGMLAGAGPVDAHHSFAAEYDSNKPVTLTGTVTEVHWTNPHARFSLNVKDKSGKSAIWEFELGSPNVLQRAGWTRHSLKVGDRVTVHGFLAKDGSNLANAKEVTLPDGQTVFAGSSIVSPENVTIPVK